MSDPVVINIARWVENAREDPLLYLERQATEVVLTSIGMAPELNRKIFLKGGTLMGVMYDSPRQTADVDFSTTLAAEPTMPQRIRAAIDVVLPAAAAHLGYLDIVCRVQSLELRPTSSNFSEASFPAIKCKIGYARRDSPQSRHLENLQSPDVVRLDINFNEPIAALQLAVLGPSGVELCVYSIEDLVSEKLRALLQQVPRNRYRPQDIFDIALLLRQSSFSDAERRRILAALRKKCLGRSIDPTSESLSSPEVVRRASSEWQTMALEVGDLPTFDESFNVVNDFYRSLPW